MQNINSNPESVIPTEVAISNKLAKDLALNLYDFIVLRIRENEDSPSSSILDTLLNDVAMSIDDMPQE